MRRLGPVGAVFERFGAVKAGPFTAARLLREREAVLLFPGGGREVRPNLYQNSFNPTVVDVHICRDVFQ